MKSLFKFKYPKLALLLLFSISSYLIFSTTTIQEAILSLSDLRYLGIFIAGLFFSFGFSTPFAIGFFIAVRPDNLYAAAIIGGIGALISDLLIFKLIRFSFMDEFRRLENTAVIKEISHAFSVKLFSKIRIYILYLFAGIIISSPLPDEIGVSMLAGLTKIRTSILAVISLLMNALGIFLILLLGRIV